MKATRLSKLLGIQHPIIQAGMTWVSNAELAAAVSDAGGLGVIVPNAGLTPDGDLIENFYTQLRKVRVLTSKPYGVSLSLKLPQISSLIDVAIEQSAPVVIMCQGNPGLNAGHLKDARILVMHIASTVHQARSAEARGADVVIAEGYEAGSKTDRNELPTLALVPQIVDAVEIPVVASGGIADGRGVAAALCLGASGVQVGTRFLATRECITHPRIKDLIINAIDTSTIIVDRNGSHARVLKSRWLSELEGKNSSYERAKDFLSEEKARRALLEGSLDDGVAFCGASVGLITEVISAGQLVKQMVSGADEILAKVK